MKKTSVMLSSSSRAMKNNSHPVSQSPRYKGGVTISQARRSSILAGGSDKKLNTVGHSFGQSPTRAVRVLDDEGKDVTPQPLYEAEPEHTQPKPSTVFLDEIFPGSGSDYSKSTSSFNIPSTSSLKGSSQLPSVSTRGSLTLETEESVRKLDISIRPPAPYDVLRKRDNVKQLVPEEMLDEVVHIILSETDTITLLDKPPTHVSEEADDAKAIKEKNTEYAELCKNRRGNDKYMERSMQTLTGALKTKQLQSDEIVMVEEGSMATVWDIYDSFCDHNQTPDSETGATSTMTSSNDKEKKGEKSSSGTGSSGSTISSLLEMEMHGNSVNAEPDAALIMWSESFQHSLLVMERSILANVFQSKLAAYRQLPAPEDPNSTVTPGAKQQSEGGEETPLSPSLERLWAFCCELTEGQNITSMAWNKENTDLLAVGYSEYDFINVKPGLICCWSLKNPTWPERVFHCHSGVTSLDFSANNPSQLAVGMFDGTVAIYDVQSRNKTCIVGSSNCSKRHLHPVWQVTWTKQEVGISGEDKVEALVSVSADSRITKWLLCGEGLNCIDLMRLRKTQNPKKKTAAKKKTDSVLSTVSPGLCIHFHPLNTGVYLVGTREGHIHKFSFFDSQNTLETYKKHISPVNHVEWSPFCSDAYLSCSSDWTIQLWKQGRLSPVLSFTSIQSAVCAVRWSPNCSTIFAAVNEQQVEIWDLNSNLVYPSIVLHAAPSVKWTSLLFARETDCVLVGDSVGQVTVYQLKNLRVGQGQQVDHLEDIIRSAVSR